jgi:hypothetical protein
MRLSPLRTGRLPIETCRPLHRRLTQGGSAYRQRHGFAVMVQAIESHSLRMGGRDMQEQTLDEIISG